MQAPNRSAGFNGLEAVDKVGHRLSERMFARLSNSEDRLATLRLLNRGIRASCPNRSHHARNAPSGLYCAMTADCPSFVHPLGRIGWTAADGLDVPKPMTRSYVTATYQVDMSAHPLKVATRVRIPLGLQIDLDP